MEHKNRFDGTNGNGYQPVPGKLFKMNPDTVRFDDFLKNSNMRTIMHMVGDNEPNREISVTMTYQDLFVIHKLFTENEVLRKEWLKKEK